jgi:hypothetical protein
MRAKEVETLGRVPASLGSAPYGRRGLGPAMLSRRVVHG